MKKLSKKTYWEKLYDIEGFNSYSKIKTFFSYSLQNFEYFRIVKPFIKKRYQKILEIGCAPGSYLIKAHKILNLKPCGIDYSMKGIRLTRKNFIANNIKNYELYCADIFDKNFQERLQEKFDVVISNGFIEHFTDFKKTLRAHTNLAKKEGLIVISIPNLRYLNKYLTIQEALDITNLKVMNINFIKANIPQNLSLLYCSYYGGPFNSGIFFFKNKLLEFPRKIFFICQRLFFDPLFIALSYLGIKFNWKYTSPAIIFICERKK